MKDKLDEWVPVAQVPDPLDEWVPVAKTARVPSVFGAVAQRFNRIKQEMDAANKAMSDLFFYQFGAEGRKIADELKYIGFTANVAIKLGRTRDGHPTGDIQVYIDNPKYTSFSDNRDPFKVIGEWGQRYFNARPKKEGRGLLWRIPV